MKRLALCALAIQLCAYTVRAGKPVFTDGTNLYSASGSGTVQSVVFGISGFNTATQLANTAVQRAGDTMTGQLNGPDATTSNGYVNLQQLQTEISLASVHDLFLATNLSTAYGGSNLYEELPTGYIDSTITYTIANGTNTLGVWWLDLGTADKILDGTYVSHLFANVTKGVAGHSYAYGFEMLDSASNVLRASTFPAESGTGLQFYENHLHFPTQHVTQAVGFRMLIVRDGVGANGSAVVYFGDTDSHISTPGGLGEVSTAAFDGGTIHANTTLGNANPKLSLTNGNWAASVYLTNNEVWVTHTMNEVVTNLLGYESNTNAPAGWWDFEQSNGVLSLDISGNAFHATNLGGCAQVDVQTNRAGRMEHAYYFNGTNQMFMMPRMTNFWNPNLSVGIWLFALRSNAGLEQVYSAWGDTGGKYNWGIGLDWTDDQKIQLYTYNTAAASVKSASSQNYPTGVWIRVVATVDDANNLQTLYTNGVQTDQDAFTALNTNVCRLCIGTDLGLTSDFQGYLDDAFYLPYVMSSNQVWADYTNSSPLNNIYSRSTDPSEIQTNTTEYPFLKSVASGVQGTAPRLIFPNLPLGPVGSAGTLYTNASGALYVK